MGTLILLIRKWQCYILLCAFTFLSINLLLFQVCDVLAMAAHDLLSTFVLGFLVKNLECEEDEVEGLPVLPSSEQVEVLVAVLVVEDSTLLE